MTVTGRTETPAPVSAEEPDHVVLIVGWYHDEDRAVAAIRDGRSFYHLDLDGARHLLPDQCSAVCTCGAASARVPSWEDARWWCREHRTSVGLPCQEWINQQYRWLRHRAGGDTPRVQTDGRGTR